MMGTHACHGCSRSAGQVGAELGGFGENLDLRSTVRCSRLEKAREMAEVVGSEDDVDVGKLPDERLAVALSDAPADRDELARVARSSRS